MAASRLAMLAIVKALMRNSDRLNMGAAECSSMIPKTTRTRAPPMMAASTAGLVQPVEESP